MYPFTIDQSSLLNGNTVYPCFKQNKKYDQTIKI